MKKSQNILLFSALIPIVAAPIAIVASCAGETQSSTYTVAATNQFLVRPKLTDEMKAKPANSVTKDDIKNIIKNNPDSLFFVTKGKIPNDTFWDTNLEIGLQNIPGEGFGTNDKEGAVIFVYTLNNATDEPNAKPNRKTIKGIAAFVGFAATSTNQQ